MLRRACVVCALAGSGLVWSACYYDFEIPESADDSDGASGDSRNCPANETCTLECSSSACSPRCNENTTCTVNCGSGACRPYCAPNATCTINCASGVCQVKCDGLCTIDCGSGVCTCDGPGCR